MTAARVGVEPAVMMRELLAWLNERLAPDGPRILELIAWTERAIGREIADGEIRTENFASAARIVDTFATGGTDAHG